VIARQHLENALENTALRPSIEALMDNFPITKTFGQVTPWNARSVPVQDGLDKQSIISRRAPDMVRVQRGAARPRRACRRTGSRRRWTGSRPPLSSTGANGLR
jgi:hypothetical protein